MPPAASGRTGAPSGASGRPRAVTEPQLAEIIEQGHETPGVEFKSPGSRSDRPFFARVARAALSLANRRGGGSIIIGVREGPGPQELIPEGLTPEQLHTWNHDEIAAALDLYADPYVTVAVDVSPSSSVKV